MSWIFSIILKEHRRRTAGAVLRMPGSTNHYSGKKTGWNKWELQKKGWVTRRRNGAFRSNLTKNASSEMLWKRETCQQKTDVGQHSIKLYLLLTKTDSNTWKFKGSRGVLSLAYGRYLIQWNHKEKLTNKRGYYICMRKKKLLYSWDLMYIGPCIIVIVEE